MTPSASALRRMMPRASAASSTNWQNLAPRDKASSPMAPVPAKRSRTRAPSIENPSIPCARMLKIASLTRSDVGRVAWLLGPARPWPLNFPPTMRMARFLQAAADFGHTEEDEDASGDAVDPQPDASPKRVPEARDAGDDEAPPQKRAQGDAAYRCQRACRLESGFGGECRENGREHDDGRRIGEGEEQRTPEGACRRDIGG